MGVIGEPGVSGKLRTVHVACPHDCPDGCSMRVTVDASSGRAVKVEGDPTHPVTRGYLCNKVNHYLDLVYNDGHCTILIMDNSTTAMTGLQGHPGNGRTALIGHCAGYRSGDFLSEGGVRSANQ
jgi:hypothetical protein